MSDAVMTACLATAALNTVLAVVLGAVYVRNHAQIRSMFTLGLLLFAAALLVHNGMQVWHFVTMMPSFAAVDPNLILVENVLQTASLGALVGATLR